MNMKVKLHSLCLKIVGRQLSAKSSLVNEHLKAIHETFHVEIYIKLKPTERKITYLLYIF